MSKTKEPQWFTVTVRRVTDTEVTVRAYDRADVDALDLEALDDAIIDTQATAEDVSVEVTPAQPYTPAADWEQPNLDLTEDEDDDDLDL